MGTQEATTFYDHLHWDWVVVRRRPEFDAFWQELLSRLPDLRPLGAPTRELDELSPHLLSTPGEIGERERLKREAKDPHLRPARLHPVPAIPHTSPWASSLSPMASAISLAISGSYLKRTLPILFEMASRYGLIVYDPQEGQVTLPPSLQGPGDPLSVAVRLTLRIEGEVPSSRAHLIFDGCEVVTDVRLSRREAHALARVMALEHNLLFYEVIDPICLPNGHVQKPDFVGDFDSAVQDLVKRHAKRENYS